MGQPEDKEAMSGSLFHLRSDQLAGLLNSGAERRAGRRADGPSIARELCARLGAVLPLDASAQDSLPAVLARPCDEMSRYRGRTIAEVLLDPGTDMAALRLLKDYEKRLVGRSGSDAAKTVATVLYYTAIAAALVCHGEKITEHGYEDLEHFLSALAGKPWLPAYLREVLARARQICQTRAGQ